MKLLIDIEHLLQWAYRDELVKRVTSSAEDVWTRVADIGRWGGVDVQHHHGGPQRYDHGMPHPDALLLERVVAGLPNATIDWRREARAVLGDLLGLIDPTPDSRDIVGERVSTSSWPTRAGERHTVVLDPPRRVLFVRTLRTTALVTMHAKMGTRPNWREDTPHPLPTPARHGPNAKIVGECFGKGRYSEGSHCPIRWWPSPITIAEARADYLAWWRGLDQLARQLRLGEHDPHPPLAPEFPWHDAGVAERQTRRA